MNRWSLGIAAAVGLIVGAVDVARAQSFYVYEAPPVYSTPVYAAPAYVPGVAYQQVVVPARSVVTAAYVEPYVYSAPVLVQQPIAQMVYSSSVIVPTRAFVAAPVVVSAPVVLASPTTVVETTRVNRHNYVQTARVYGPTDGPRYSRVHVHSGLFGTTVRERVR